MVLVLTKSDVASVLVIGDVIDVVEQAHAALASGQAVEPGRPAVALPDSSSVLMPMAAAVGPRRAIGVKLLTDSPDNPARLAARQQSTIVLVDAETGACEAFLDGSVITLFRTAAASAVATRYLANPDGGVLGLVGAGAQARAHLAAIRTIRPVERVVVWSRSRSTAARFAGECADPALTVDVVDTPEQVVRAANVLCTLTPGRGPIVRGDWFGPGLHVNAVGAPPRPDHREIDTEGIRRSRVVVDSFAVATGESGDVMIPLAERAITEDHVRDEIGQVIVGTRPGRGHARQVTLYKSVGLGIQDIATARLVVDLARQKDIGQHIELA